MPGCGSGVLVSSSSLLIRSHHGRCQAKIPLSPLCKFAEPPLSILRLSGSRAADRLHNKRNRETQRKITESGEGARPFPKRWRGGQTSVPLPVSRRQGVEDAA